MSIQTGDIVQPFEEMFNSFKNLYFKGSYSTDLWFVTKQEPVGGVTMTHLRNMSTGSTMKLTCANKLFTKASETK